MLIFFTIFENNLINNGEKRMGRDTDNLFTMTTRYFNESWIIIEFDFELEERLYGMHEMIIKEYKL